MLTKLARLFRRKGKKTVSDDWWDRGIPVGRVPPEIVAGIRKLEEEGLHEYCLARYGPDYTKQDRGEDE